MLRTPDLSFPCGVSPGFDPSHQMSRNVYFSAVATPGGAVNLLTGGKPAITGTPTFGIDGGIGPRLVAAGGTDNLTWPIAGKNDTNFTMGVIFTIGSAALQTLLVGIGSGNGVFLRANLGTPEIRISGTGSLSNTFPLVASVPYFYAASASRDTGSWNHNHVLVDLRSGKILTSSTTGTALGTSPATGTYSLAGNNTSAISTGMFSGAFSSLAQLQQFAADPWSFWYPR